MILYDLPKIKSEFKLENHLLIPYKKEDWISRVAHTRGPRDAARAQRPAGVAHADTNSRSRGCPCQGSPARVGAFAKEASHFS